MMLTSNRIFRVDGVSIIMVLCLSSTVKGNNKTNAFDLHDFLMRNYDSDVVPSKDTEIINVNITFNLMALLRFDAAEETLITAAWLSIRWNDYSLK